MSGHRVLAVDLGATSIRVAAVDLGAPAPHVEIVHRWNHGPVPDGGGHLRWDWDGIVAEVERGLQLGMDAGPVASIGVDGWAVDYGLLDTAGTLVAPPFSYRDERTEGWESTVEHVGAARLYELTGIQLMRINTIFQLAAHDPDELDRASRLLLLPDLLVHHLVGGWDGAERSNATTTALLDAHTGTWSPELIHAVGLPLELFPPVRPAGMLAGSWRDVPVHLVGSHDTASAFVAAPGVPGPGSAVVSCGTWVLVGTERAEPDTSARARAANASNEGGALGGVRFLRNVMGFWLLERCRAAWGDPLVDELAAAAAQVDADTLPLIDAMDPRFLDPDDMEREIRVAAGLPDAAGRAEVTRCILESIAAAVARVTAELGEITGDELRELLVVGGAARMELMNELLARHTGVPVTVGSPEAAALGNAAVQGIALGRFGSLDDARAWVATSGRRYGRATAAGTSRVGTGTGARGHRSEG